MCSPRGFQKGSSNAGGLIQCWKIGLIEHTHTLSGNFKAVFSQHNDDIEEFDKESEEIKGDIINTHFLTTLPKCSLILAGRVRQGLHLHLGPLLQYPGAL